MLPQVCTPTSTFFSSATPTAAKQYVRIEGPDARRRRKLIEMYERRNRIWALGLSKGLTRVASANGWSQRLGMGMNWYFASLQEGGTKYTSVCDFHQLTDLRFVRVEFSLLADLESHLRALEPLFLTKKRPIRDQTVSAGSVIFLTSFHFRHDILLPFADVRAFDINSASSISTVCQRCRQAHTHKVKTHRMVDR